MTRQLLFAIPFAVFLHAVPAHGEVTNCDGIWTTGSCGEAAKGTFGVSVAPKPSPEMQEMRKRRGWLHELDMLRLRAKRELDVQASVEHVRETCMNENTKAAECAKLIAEREKEIQSLMVAKREALAAEAKATQDENAKEGNTQQVVVVEQRRRFPIRAYDGLIYRPGVPGIRRRPHHRHYGTTTTSGVQLEGSFTSSDGRTRVGGSVGTHTSQTK